jgi:septal ring factor EnvC (AmiA/AmiB activator)
MAQNLTRFTLTMVVLGVLLALAVFEPEVFPITLPGTEAPKETPQDFEKKLAELNEREAELARREAEVNAREDAQIQLRTELGALEVTLTQRKAELDAREKVLDQWEDRLKDREDALKKRLTVAAAPEPPSSPGQESSPTDKQRQEGCLRLAIVAALVSSLMAGFSALALVAAGRKHSRQSGDGVSRSQGSQARSRKQGHYGRGVVGTLRQSPTKSNGRARTA